MFTKAIETAAKYTRPICSISRNYGSTTIQPGTATLFFVNSDGWALTCRHVANQLAVGANLARKAKDFRRELASLRGSQKEKRLLKELEKKYGYKKNTAFELHNRFINCVEGTLEFRVIKSKKYDIALIKFENYTQLQCDTFPIFPSDTSSLQPGKMLCRLGFPFPEFTNFAYDDKTDEITWTDTGNLATPRFPIEGMVTRRIVDTDGRVFAFEMSTPGLRGQSGGPAFDTEGKVWGVQFATKHLDLDFDVDQEVLRKGTKRHVKDSAFLHVGACIHIDVVKAFMKENDVVFTEG
jgi:hypothetical protein